MKKIIFAGDSVTVGMGCVNPAGSSYARLISDHYGVEMLNLARPSASMYATYLQALYGAERLGGELVIFTTTPLDRIDWVSDTSEYSGRLEANHVMEWSPHMQNDYAYYFKDRPDYNPIIYSETTTFLHYVQGHDHPKLVGESPTKLKALLDYAAVYRDERIHKDHCEGLILSAYVRLKRMGVPCLFVLNGNFTHMTDLVEYSVNIDFAELARELPGTDEYHTNEEGHMIAAERIITAINDYGLSMS